MSEEGRPPDCRQPRDLHKDRHLHRAHLLHHRQRQHLARRRVLHGRLRLWQVVAEVLGVRADHGLCLLGDSQLPCAGDVAHRGQRHGDRVRRCLAARHHQGCKGWQSRRPAVDARRLHLQRCMSSLGVAPLSRVLVHGAPRQQCTREVGYIIHLTPHAAMPTSSGVDIPHRMMSCVRPASVSRSARIRRVDEGMSLPLVRDDGCGRRPMPPCHTHGGCELHAVIMH